MTPLLGVNFCYEGRKFLTVPHEKAPANSVPAAAVRQKVQALLGITGRKASVGVLPRLVLNFGAQPRMHIGYEQDRVTQRHLECRV